MKFMQSSMLRRMVAGQLLTIVAFCAVTAGNLLWEFKKNEVSNELDKDTRIMAQSLVNTLDPASNTPAQMRQKIETIYKLMQEMYRIKKSELVGKNAAIEQSLDFAMHITTLDGIEIFRSPGYSLQQTGVAKTGSLSLVHQGHEWRLFTLVEARQGLIIRMAESDEAINENIGDLIRRFIVIPLLWFLPFAALVTYHASLHGLQPLRALAQSISLRNSNDMSPIEPKKSYTEIQPIVDELNALFLKLKTTLERERHFLADAAHELRTPLAVIQAQAYVLNQAHDSAAKAIAADELNAGIDRAASLIQKLLLTAKVSMDNYTPRLQVVDLCAFVQERMASMSVLASHKDIEMELAAPHSCKVQLDRETFISALDNVLDNAIRYTPQGGQILVSLELLSDREHVALRVADSGAGIPLELYERVFERFFRIAGTEQQGSGLGLAIVKRVLALHGGDVALSTGLNQRGLSVSLTMPLQLVKPH